MRLASATYLPMLHNINDCLLACKPGVGCRGLGIRDQQPSLSIVCRLSSVVHLTPDPSHDLWGNLLRLCAGRTYFLFLAGYSSCYHASRESAGTAPLCVLTCVWTRDDEVLESE